MELQPLYIFVQASKARAELLKKEKRDKYVRDHREIINEQKRLSRKKSAASNKKDGGTGATG